MINHIITGNPLFVDDDFREFLRARLSCQTQWTVGEGGAFKFLFLK